jgi:hypothetical protein
MGAQPEPVLFPRKALSQVFAVLLMRSAYDAVDQLDFIPMVSSTHWGSGCPSHLMAQLQPAACMHACMSVECRAARQRERRMQQEGA